MALDSGIAPDVITVACDDLLKAGLVIRKKSAPEPEAAEHPESGPQVEKAAAVSDNATLISGAVVVSSDNASTAPPAVVIESDDATQESTKIPAVELAEAASAESSPSANKQSVGLGFSPIYRYYRDPGIVTGFGSVIRVSYDAFGGAPFAGISVFFQSERVNFPLKHGDAMVTASESVQGLGLNYDMNSLRFSMMTGFSQNYLE